MNQHTSYTLHSTMLIFLVFIIRCFIRGWILSSPEHNYSYNILYCVLVLLSLSICRLCCSASLSPPMSLLITPSASARLSLFYIMRSYFYTTKTIECSTIFLSFLLRSSSPFVVVVYFPCAGMHEHARSLNSNTNISSSADIEIWIRKSCHLDRVVSALEFDRYL